MSALTRLGVSAYQAPAAGASFIVGTNRTLASTSDTYAFNTTGAAAGDYLFLFMNDDTSGPPTVTLIGSGNTLAVIANDNDTVTNIHLQGLALTAGDISNGTIKVESTTGTNFSAQIGILRGVTTLTPHYVYGSGSTLAFAGISPPALGVIIAVSDKNASAGGPLSADNGTWAIPVQSQPGGYYFSCSILTQFSGYANATTTVSGFSTNTDQSGWLLGLT